jgi:hypothetical protein
VPFPPARAGSPAGKFLCHQRRAQGAQRQQRDSPERTCSCHELAVLTSAVGHGDFAFILLAINPLGGLLIAIPMAVFTLGYPLWLAVAAGVPLAYVQVAVVDLFWEQLDRMVWWQRLLERQRSPRVERLMASPGAFWPIVVLTPLLGPWLIMACMRFARVPQRRVAPPILLGLTWIALLIGAVCRFAPHLVRAS